MRLIDNILIKEMGFTSTTHDRCIYKHDNIFNETVYIIRQVDDFMLGCKDEKTAKDIFNIIGTKLQFPSEKLKGVVPFEYLGLVTDYNGVDIRQTRDYIEMHCTNYIDRLLKSHSWTTKSDDDLSNNHLGSTKPVYRVSQPYRDNLSDEELLKQFKANEKSKTHSMKSSKPLSPLPADCIDTMFKEVGPLEGSVDHTILEKKNGFGYRTLLGELMYAYITCRPDIGYAITSLSKFSTRPSAVHYKLLRGVAKYLRSTRSWGIRFHRSEPMNDMEPGVKYDIELPSELSAFPVDIKEPRLKCFVDAAHGNDLRQRRSTTGYVFTFAGGAVVYKSKTQTLTAGSSTEAEFIAAVSAAKAARYLRSVLREMGFEQRGPTIIYIDNMSALKIINDNTSPTERTRHMDIRFFQVQDWRLDGDIIMKHIPGILNPSDDLTKPLGWVLHSRHCRRIMGHFEHA